MYTCSVAAARPTRLLSSKLFIDVLCIQLEHVVIVIEEVQGPIAASSYELAPHRLKFGDGSFQNFACSVKGNMVAGPSTLNGRANEHNPSASQSDEGFQMSLIVLTLDRSRAEEIVKQPCCPRGVFYYESNVAKRLEHDSPW